MKRGFLVFFIFHLLLLPLYAQQNLVPNYSFEQKLNCINDFDEFTGYVADWTGQGYLGGGLSWITAQCNSFGMAGVPDNEWGHRYARTGNSYAGIITYIGPYLSCPICNNARNYIQVQLINTLIAGTKYCVVFYVNLSDTSKYACNDIGAYFSDSALYNNPTLRVKSNFVPQVANDPINNPLTDKINWTKVTGSFVATGGEQYIVIGNFKTDSASSIDSVGSRASNSMEDAMGGYYYVDDVSVLKVIPAHAGRDTSICNGNKILIGKDTAVPGVSYSWLPTRGLSNANGAQTFASPTVTTTYTVTVINDSMKSCGCPDSLTKDSVTISIYNMPLTVCCSAIIKEGQSITLNASPSYKFLWIPNAGLDNDTAQSIMCSPLITTTYTVLAKDSAGCTVRDSLTITIENKDTIVIPNVFTPDGDGINDVMYILGKNIISMDFIIFDRWGSKVFESKNISNGWNGEYDGHPASEGTYFYILNASFQDGGSLDKKGDITLIR